MPCSSGSRCRPPRGVGLRR
uniref:Uncharacterized protein n=1 Tax=Arundo donax TaxID=35708 RepID=A0A0A9CHY3_ARUDO